MTVEEISSVTAHEIGNSTQSEEITYISLMSGIITALPAGIIFAITMSPGYDLQRFNVSA